jgi:serine phosphatase RsbU (regulator of sigma subunit)
MCATIARAAMTAHTGYRHSPGQLLQRVGDTLWQTSTGEQLVSLLYARVDPDSGEGEVASAGNISAMISSRYGYRPLVEGLGGEPLTTHIESQSVSATFRMMPGETLLAYTEGVTTDGATQSMLGESICGSMREEDYNPLASLRRQLAKRSLRHERGMVTLTRD